MQRLALRCVAESYVAYFCVSLEIGLKWSANFQLKMSEVKVIGRQKPHEIAAYLAYMVTYGRPIKRRWLRRQLQN